jgi:hypothetical protein
MKLARISPAELACLDPEIVQANIQPILYRRVHFSLHPGIMIGQVRSREWLDQVVAREPDVPRLLDGLETAPPDAG